jgi:ribonuclease HII
MVELDACYPEYGFAKHKGYGTKQHLSALEEFGALKNQHRYHIERLNCSLHCQHRGLQNINVINFTCA